MKLFDLHCKSNNLFMFGIQVQSVKLKSDLKMNMDYTRALNLLSSSNNLVWLLKPNSIVPNKSMEQICGVFCPFDWLEGKWEQWWWWL